MIWFNGTVKNAVDKVKCSSSVLLVFVQGEDDLSKHYEAFLNNEAEIESENYVAIKITHNSVALEQFKKIYFTVPIPSVFLIGANGLPLGITCSKEPSDLQHLIRDVAIRQKNESLKINANSPANETNSSSNVDKKDVKNVREISRRWNCLDERNDVDVDCDRFLMEDEKLLHESLRKYSKLTLNGPHSSCEKICISQKIQSARIQFCLPSNEIRAWEFPNMCTLHDVKLYIMETMKLKADFKLLRTYPRTAFTSQDEDKTLTDLSLTPNATLIVVPVQNECIQSRLKKIIMKKNLLITFVTTIFQPVFTIFSYFKRLLLGPPEEKNVNIRKDSRRSTQKRVNKNVSTSNIHGFAFDGDSDTDSDMNTDNGNSTQQK